MFQGERKKRYGIQKGMMSGSGGVGVSGGAQRHREAGETQADDGDNDDGRMMLR